MANPDDVLAFWLDELGPEGWHRGGADLDRDIRERFMETWQQARQASLGLWLTYATGTLAYVILTDQLSRNMFRDSDQAFAADKSARAAAKAAIARGWDMKIDEPARQFFYMPLVHSENLCDQDRSVRLMCNRLPDAGKNLLLHAKAHREIIRRFGRFPFRNKALGRESTALEIEFMDQGAYGSIVEALKAKQAA